MKTSLMSLMVLSGTLAVAPAFAGDSDAILGGVVGSAIGAAIGHDMNGHNGAVVGAAIGGAAGVAIADRQRGYHSGGPVRVVSHPEPVYRQPVYVEPVTYVRPVRYVRVDDDRPRGWDRDDRHEFREWRRHERWEDRGGWGGNYREHHGRHCRDD